ncbi:D-aminoacyl-tRNA deacylase [Kallotenue papyrolyticum]|uniref:D-aminoacyl-tRNA deacylase n=1 Tax=Kallotenue papyrolyticum TaxID=1325125 RepID=UPI0004785BBF|nr:D-aminoacyl-tRNA deacylase [Kallotenue papyrolyticum]
MRALIQRVSRASVRVDGATVGAIGPGLVILLGVGVGDSEREAALLAEKIAHLRIFADAEGKFNRSLLEVGGAALVVSQFTLFADTRKGRRPSFTQAAPPEQAAPLVERFAALLREQGIAVATGRFGALMEVELVNQGPVTIWLDSDDWQRPRRADPSDAPRR